MQGFYIKGCESQAYPHAQGHADLNNVITGLQQNQPDGYVSWWNNEQDKPIKLDRKQATINKVIGKTSDGI